MSVAARRVRLRQGGGGPPPYAVIASTERNPETLAAFLAHLAAAGIACAAMEAPAARRFPRDPGARLFMHRLYPAE